MEDDIFEHLREVPERSLGGVFSARVIEFLPTHLQVKLIALCSKKLRPGGVIVIETMNPESKVGFGRTSYLDRTQVHAVPPELMKSALESNCFGAVKISVLAPVEGSLTPITPSRGFFQNRNGHAEILPGASNRVTTSPAYAAVAWRSDKG